MQAPFITESAPTETLMLKRADVADMDAKHDALVVGKPRVALDHRVPEFGRAAHGDGERAQRP